MLLGRIALEITCADYLMLLNKIYGEQINVSNVEYQGGLKLSMSVIGRDYFRLRSIVIKQGGDISIKKYGSIAQRGALYLRQHVMLPIILIFLIVVTVCVPRYILLVSVTGNVTVPSNQIVEAAEMCGLRFGTSRSRIHSEAIKNALLEKIPDLQWVGVNTRGCVAVISVREKTSGEKVANSDNQVTSIVASRDGIIRDYVVYKGNPLCSTGQAVKAGQVLVSGYTDCGNILKATRAEAEIKALTNRELQIISPVASIARGVAERKATTYSLRIGKKLINLSKHSGNPDTSCGKIYSEEILCLPGGFVLPISLIKETTICYDTTDCVSEDGAPVDWLYDYAREYLKSSMIAGEILGEQTELLHIDDAWRLQGRFICVEMIGQTKYEQSLLKG